MSQEKYLVIGGSQGIGWEVVNILRPSVSWLGVVARSEGNLQTLSDVRFTRLDVVHEALPLEFLPAELDGLAYCPGTINLKRFDKLADSDFTSDFNVNVLGAARIIRSCLPFLRKSKRRSSIVLMSSVAVQTGMPFHGSVAASKGAVEGLARALAAEFAPQIRVNAVAPSLTDTRLSHRLISTEQKRRAAEKRHPLKRIGSAKDIAHAIAFLLSDQSSWITGQVLHVDGGLSTIRLFEP